jgi:hypothetical protein
MLPVFEVMPPFKGRQNLFTNLKIFWKPFCSFVRSSMLSISCRSLRLLSPCRLALASTSSSFSNEKLVTWSMHEQHDGVASLVLNNPAKLNALTVEMGSDFIAAISELAAACEKVKYVCSSSSTLHFMYYLSGVDTADTSHLH